MKESKYLITIQLIDEDETFLRNIICSKKELKSAVQEIIDYEISTVDDEFLEYDGDVTCYEIKETIDFNLFDGKVEE